MAQATQFKLDATKSFYALAGTADLAVERARKVATEVQSQVDEALARVSKVDADPKALSETARKQVADQLDAVLKDVKKAQNRVEARLNELPGDLKALPQRIDTLLAELQSEAKSFPAKAEARYDELQPELRALIGKYEARAADLRKEVEKAYGEKASVFADLASRGEAAVAKVRGESVPPKAAPTTQS